MPNEPVSTETDALWGGWPHCPECGQLRQTACPACGTAGTDFALAEYQPPAAPLQSPLREAAGAPSTVSGDEDLPLLHCAICDEIFRPRFHPRCHACGHPFAASPFPENSPFPAVTGRVLLLLVLLTLGLGTLAIYFWLLLRAA